jgi:hypothetical protein
MGIPMLTVGIRRYTNTNNRGFAFGLFYSVMNIAAFVSGPVIDLFNMRTGLSAYGNLSGNRMVILTTSCVSVCSFFITYFKLREIRISEDDQNENENVDDNKGVSITNLEDIEERKDNDDNMYNPLNNTSDKNIEMTSISSNHIAKRIKNSSSSNDLNCSHINISNNKINEFTEYKPKPLSFYNTTKELFKSITFWRFCAFSLFLINLRAIFRHLDATLPTYLVRIFGDKVPKGQTVIYISKYNYKHNVILLFYFY